MKKDAVGLDQSFGNDRCKKVTVDGFDVDSSL